jgi:hypothetical protein
MSSGDGSIMLDWGGETRRFRLKIGQFRELQEAINRPRCALGAQPIGPNTFYHLLASGDAWPHEVREVIRLGLIGGGLPLAQVPGLMRRYFDEQPLPESALIAPGIFAAGYAGPPEDQAGKKADAETTTSRSPSPPSMAPAAPSDSLQERSIN